VHIYIQTCQKLFEKTNPWPQLAYLQNIIMIKYLTAELKGVNNGYCKTSLQAAAATT